MLLAVNWYQNPRLVNHVWIEGLLRMGDDVHTRVHTHVHSLWPWLPGAAASSAFRLDLGSPSDALQVSVICLLVFSAGVVGVCWLRFHGYR